LAGIDNGNSFTRLPMDLLPLPSKDFLVWTEMQMLNKRVSTEAKTDAVVSLIISGIMMTRNYIIQNQYIYTLGHKRLTPDNELQEHVRIVDANHAIYDNDLRHHPIIGVDDEEMVTLDSGDNHTLSTNDKGQVFSIGLGFDGSTGHGSDAFGIKNFAFTERPLRVIQKLNGIFIASVAAGSHHSLALSREGNVYSFGTNDCGQLGHKPNGVDGDIFTEPKLIENLNNISYIAAGESHSMAISGGRAISFGSSLFAQCGRGRKLKTPNDYKPYLIDSLYAVCKVSTSFRHTLFLTLSGIVYSCGLNGDGQCGGHPTAHPNPGMFPYLNGWQTNEIPRVLATTVIVKDIDAVKSHSVIVFMSEKNGHLSSKNITLGSLSIH
jgi:hypothetical protein